jgi:Zn-dependent protease with chaperone function
MHAHQPVTGVLLTSRSRLFEIYNMQFNRDSETRSDWLAARSLFPANPAMAMQHRYRRHIRRSNRIA